MMYIILEILINVIFRWMLIVTSTEMRIHQSVRVTSPIT